MGLRAGSAWGGTSPLYIRRNPFCGAKKLRARGSTRQNYSQTDMILTTCAVCAAPLADDAPAHCVNCQTKYCSDRCLRYHSHRGGHDDACDEIARSGGAEQYHADKITMRPSRPRLKRARRTPRIRRRAFSRTFGVDQSGSWATPIRTRSGLESFWRRCGARVRALPRSRSTG